MFVRVLARTDGQMILTTNRPKVTPSAFEISVILNMIEEATNVNIVYLCVDIRSHTYVRRYVGNTAMFRMELGSTLRPSTL